MIDSRVEFRNPREAEHWLLELSSAYHIFELHAHFLVEIELRPVLARGVAVIVKKFSDFLTQRVTKTVADAELARVTAHPV